MLFLKIVVALAVALILWRFVILKLMFAYSRRRINNELDVEGFNRNSDYSLPGFDPVHNELTDAKITIEGELPDGLDGLYLRNGTNSQFDRTQSRRHMFNATGMIHQINIQNGQASYTNRFTKTPRYLIEKSAGREMYIEFGDVVGGGAAAMKKIMLSLKEQKFGLAPKLETLENSGSTTAIQFHNGKLYALQESNVPFELDCHLEDGKLTINGTGHFEHFGGKLDHPLTAHPKIDPETGDWFSFGTDSLNSGKIHYSIIKQGQLTRHETVMTPKPFTAFIHESFLTKHYSILPDSSLKQDGSGLMQEHKSVIKFDHDYKMRFAVIPRDFKEGDDIQWFTTKEAGHIWHNINSWEETRDDGGTDIVLITPVYKDYSPEVPIHTSKEDQAYLTKFRLNLDSGEITEDRRLLEHFYERPSLNTQYIGKKSRYVYLLDEGGAGGVMGKGVLKYDMIDEKEVKYFDYGDYRGGEALFVPKPNSQAEDDGYLLDLLMTDDKAYMVIIDAASMEEIAKLHMPQRVPYGVHACWLNQEQQAALVQH